MANLSGPVRGRPQLWPARSRQPRGRGGGLPAGLGQPAPPRLQRCEKPCPGGQPAAYRPSRAVASAAPPGLAVHVAAPKSADRMLPFSLTSSPQSTLQCCVLSPASNDIPKPAEYHRRTQAFIHRFAGPFEGVRQRRRQAAAQGRKTHLDRKRLQLGHLKAQLVPDSQLLHHLETNNKDLVLQSTGTGPCKQVQQAIGSQLPLNLQAECYCLTSVQALWTICRWSCHLTSIVHTEQCQQAWPTSN